MNRRAMIKAVSWVKDSETAHIVGKRVRRRAMMSAPALWVRHPWGRGNLRTCTSATGVTSDCFQTPTELSLIRIGSLLQFRPKELQGRSEEYAAFCMPNSRSSRSKALNSPSHPQLRLWSIPHNLPFRVHPFPPVKDLECAWIPALLSIVEHVR